MFDWREFLDLAEALNAGPIGAIVAIRVSESSMRSVVGRAYYAAFGHARAYPVRRLNFMSVGSAADHGRLAAHFRAHGMRQIGQHLGKLRAHRNRCDYDDIVTGLP